MLLQCVTLDNIKISKWNDFKNCKIVTFVSFGMFRLLSINFKYIYIYIYSHKHKKVSQSGLITTKNEKWHCKGSIHKQAHLHTDVYKYKSKKDFTKRKQVVPNVLKKHFLKPAMKYVK